MPKVQENIVFMCFRNFGALTREKYAKLKILIKVIIEGMFFVQFEAIDWNQMVGEF